MTKVRVCTAVAVMLFAAASFAATYTVTFEDQRFFTANVDAPFAHFSNGEVVQNSSAGDDVTSLPASSGTYFLHPPADVEHALAERLLSIV